MPGARGVTEAISHRALLRTFDPNFVLHPLEEFEDFWWHAFRGFHFSDAARRFFFSFLLHRISVHELHRPTPTTDFDDSYADAFLRGRASFLVLISSSYSGLLA